MPSYKQSSHGKKATKKRERAEVSKGYGSVVARPLKKNRLKYHECSVITQRICDDGFAQYLNECKSEEATVLGFLYGREYFFQDDLRRKKEIEEILKSKGDLNGPFERLLSLSMHAGDSVLFQGAEYAQNDLVFDMWCALIDAWGQQEGASTIFLDRKVQMVLRKQELSTNCHLLAPAVLQGYLVQQATGKFEGMLDVTKYVLHCLDSHGLSMLVHNQGRGNSLDVLEDVLAIKATTVLSSIRESNVAEVVSMFQQYGAALVHRFQVEDAFAGYVQETSEFAFAGFLQNTSEFAFAGSTALDQNRLMQIPLFKGTFASKPKRDAKHAMVLVGTRFDGTHWYFLLQNWWSEMQFVEVRGDYLMASRAQIIFAEREQLTIGDSVGLLPIILAKYAEAHVEGPDCSMVCKIALPCVNRPAGLT